MGRTDAPGSHHLGQINETMSSVSITSFIGLTHWLLPQLQALVILQADSWGPLSPPQS